MFLSVSKNMLLQWACVIYYILSAQCELFKQLLFYLECCFINWWIDSHVYDQNFYITMFASLVKSQWVYPDMCSGFSTQIILPIWFYLPTLFTLWYLINFLTIIPEVDSYTKKLCHCCYFKSTNHGTQKIIFIYHHFVQNINNTLYKLCIFWSSISN